jgi:hypothetical protein
VSPVAADHLSGEVAANFLAHGTTSSEQTVTSLSEWLRKRPYVFGHDHADLKDQRGLSMHHVTAYDAHEVPAAKVMRKLFVATVMAVSLPMLCVTAVSPTASAADCNWHRDGSGSYCVIIRDGAAQKQIEIVLESKRESTKVMTYRSNSLRAGAIFIDDEYNNRYVLQYLGPDKVILQDENGNPPAVYYR